MATNEYPLVDYVSAWTVFRRLSDEATATAIHLLDRLQRRNLKPECVFDLGCGDGKLLGTLLVRANWAPAEVVLLDPDRDFLEKAKNELACVLNVNDCGRDTLKSVNSNLQNFRWPKVSSGIALAVHVAYLIESIDFQNFIKSIPKGVLVFVVLDAEDSVFSRVWIQTAKKYAIRTSDARKTLDTLSKDGEFVVNKTEVLSELSNPLLLSEHNQNMALSLISYTDVRDLSESSIEWIREQVSTSINADGKLPCNSFCYEIERR